MSEREFWFVSDKTEAVSTDILLGTPLVRRVVQVINWEHQTVFWKDKPTESVNLIIEAACKNCRKFMASCPQAEFWNKPKFDDQAINESNTICPDWKLNVAVYPNWLPKI